MSFLRRNRFVLAFLVLVVFCSVLVVRQWFINNAKHFELRESFVLLNARGHGQQAQYLYERLIREMETASTKTLFEDFQRVSPLVDPAKPQPENLLWKYYVWLNKELDRRSQSMLDRALKLAEEGR